MEDIRILEVSVYACLNEDCPLQSNVHSEVVYQVSTDADAIYGVAHEHDTIEQGLMHALAAINDAKAQIR